MEIRDGMFVEFLVLYPENGADKQNSTPDADPQLNLYLAASARQAEVKKIHIMPLSTLSHLCDGVKVWRNSPAESSAPSFFSTTLSFPSEANIVKDHSTQVRCFHDVVGKGLMTPDNPEAQDITRI
jgi:hypothetical protein